MQLTKVAPRDLSNKLYTVKNTMYAYNMPPGAPQLSLNYVCIEIVGLIYATEENLRFLNPNMRSLLLIDVFTRNWHISRFGLIGSENQVSGILMLFYNTFWWAESRGRISFFLMWSVRDAIHGIRMSRKRVRNRPKSRIFVGQCHVQSHL